MRYTVVLPQPGQIDVGQIKPDQEILRQIQDRWNPPFTIENVWFRHDPDWRFRVMSIQCAREQNHPVWQVTGVLFGWAQMAPAMMGLVV